MKKWNGVLSSSEARRAEYYFDNCADFFAVAVKGNKGECYFWFTTPEGMHATLHSKEAMCMQGFEDRADGLRWGGLQVMHAKLMGKLGEIRTGRHWKAFEVGSNGTCSKDQEETICRIWNEKCKGYIWKWTAEEYTGPRKYKPDVTGYNPLTGRTVTLEVKGFRSRLFKG